MKQGTLGLNLSTKRTRKREFLDEMDHVVPWAELASLIEPHYPKGNDWPPTIWVGCDVAHSLPSTLVRTI